MLNKVVDMSVGDTAKYLWCKYYKLSHLWAAIKEAAGLVVDTLDALLSVLLVVLLYLTAPITIWFVAWWYRDLVRAFVGRN